MFSIIGTKVALAMGHHMMICMVAALVTGGLLRDLICGQAPLVLHDELHASVALIASGLYLTLLELGINETTNTIATLVVSYLLSIAAVRFKWRLPSFHLVETDKPLH